MIPDNCVQVVNHKKIKVEECGKKVIVNNSDQLKFQVTQIDGCALKNTLAADWMISKGQRHLIIELKGKDVAHAAKQIWATATFLVQDCNIKKNFSALVVARQYPKATTAVQKAQISFSKEFRGPLHVVTKNCEYDFEKVTSFKGPL